MRVIRRRGLVVSVGTVPRQRLGRGRVATRRDRSNIIAEFQASFPACYQVRSRDRDARSSAGRL